MDCSSASSLLSSLHLTSSGCRRRSFCRRGWWESDHAPAAIPRCVTVSARRTVFPSHGVLGALNYSSSLVGVLSAGQTRRAPCALHAELGLPCKPAPTCTSMLAGAVGDTRIDAASSRVRTMLPSMCVVCVFIDARVPQWIDLRLRADGERMCVDAPMLVDRRGHADVSPPAPVGQEGAF